MKKLNWLEAIWRRAFGYPIWTMDTDGDVRKSRMWPIGGGKVIVRAIWSKVLAEEDGTVDNSYVKRWWPR